MLDSWIACMQTKQSQATAKSSQCATLKPVGPDVDIIRQVEALGGSTEPTRRCRTSVLHLRA